MVKKRVPNWLYGSLWSSPQPLLPSPPQPYDDGENDCLPRGAAAEADSPVQTPVPEPPPSAARPEHPKVEIRDRINESSDNGSSGSGSSSVEDISRQAQLVQELCRKVINMGELWRLASQGIPDGAGIRSTVWKLLLGYLPVDRGFGHQD